MLQEESHQLGLEEESLEELPSSNVQQTALVVSSEARRKVQFDLLLVSLLKSGIRRCINEFHGINCIALLAVVNCIALLACSRLRLSFRNERHGINCIALSRSTSRSSTSGTQK